MKEREEKMEGRKIEKREMEKLNNTEKEREVCSESLGSEGKYTEGSGGKCNKYANRGELRASSSPPSVGPLSVPSV